MVGGDGIDVAAPDGRPQRVPALRPLHGRGADEIPAVLALVDVAGKLEVLGTGLSVDLIALVLGTGHRFNALFVGEVHDVQRCAGRLRPLNAEGGVPLRPAPVFPEQGGGAIQNQHGQELSNAASVL